MPIAGPRPSGASPRPVTYTSALKPVASRISAPAVTGRTRSRTSSVTRIIRSRLLGRPGRQHQIRRAAHGEEGARVVGDAHIAKGHGAAPTQQRALRKDGGAARRGEIAHVEV